MMSRGEKDCRVRGRLERFKVEGRGERVRKPKEEAKECTVWKSEGRNAKCGGGKKCKANRRDAVWRKEVRVREACEEEEVRNAPCRGRVLRGGEEVRV